MSGPADGPGTTIGRIAALETRYAELAARLDRFERETLEAAWPKDPPDCYLGGATEAEGYRDEKWRDAQS